MVTIMAPREQSDNSSILSPLRELGFLEKFRVVIHDLGFYFNVSIAARYIRTQNKLGDVKSSIYSGFRKAIEVHPALGVRIVLSTTGNLYFERIPVINLDDTISFKQLPPKESERVPFIDSLLADENSRGFENPILPLWRAIILAEDFQDTSQPFYILFVWHHVIGDGRSGLAIHSTLLETFNSTKEELTVNGAVNGGPSDAHLVATSTARLQPPLEDILSLKKSAKPGQSDDGLKNAPPEDKLSHVITRWAGMPIDRGSGQVQTKLYRVCLDDSTASNLVRSCRKHGTTITPLLQATLVHLLFTHTKEDQVRANCAISLRRFFPPHLEIDDSVMGLWISAFGTEYSRSQFPDTTQLSSVWKIAKENSARVQQEVDRGDLDIEIGDLREISDYRSYLLNKLGQPRDNSIGLTNLGVFGGAADAANQATQISDLIFSQSCHVNGAALQICVVSVAGGGMNIVFSWQEGIVTEYFVRTIGSELQKLLISLCTELDE